MNAVALARLLQLASPALPVGAYSYSQGLESAIETGIVRDAPGAARWIGDVLAFSIGTMEAPLLLRMMQAVHQGDAAAFARWNAEFLASRESAELRAETVQMGYSLRRLLVELDGSVPAALTALEEASYPAAFAAAAAASGIAPAEALVAYLFAWAENQVLVAVKAIPLGQTAGQRLVRGLAESIAPIAAAALSLRDEELANFAPGFAMASARHETQYSRLFRS